MLALLLNHPFVILFTVFVAIILWIGFKQYVLRLNMPPGPFPLPFVGNILMFKGTTTSLCTQFNELSKKYGETFTLWFGPIPSVVLNSLGSVTRNLVENPHDFSNRPDTIMGDMFMDGHPDIIFGQYNKTWQMYKKIASRCVRKVVDSKKLEEKVSEIASDIVKSLEEVPPKTPVKLQVYTQNVVYSVLASFCFGRKYDLDDPEFLELVKIVKEQGELSNDLMIFEMIPFGRYLAPLMRRFLPIFKKLDYQFDYFKQVIIREFDEHLEAYELRKNEGTAGSDIIDAMIFEMHENDEGKMWLTKQSAVTVCFDVFGAGTETTMITLRWFFLEMARNPEIQEATANQIREEIGEGDILLKHRPVLPLLEAGYLETLRLHPIAQMSVPHTPIRDGAKIDGKFPVPGNTLILQNVVAIQRNPDFFENPEKFNPSRFIDADKQVIKPRSWIPFGVGRRICLGEQLAKNDLFLIAGHILQRFRVVAIPGVEYCNEHALMNDFNALPREDYSYFLEIRG